MDEAKSAVLTLIQELGVKNEVRMGTLREAYEEYGSPVKLEVALGALKREKKVTWDTFQPASELRDVQEVRLVG